MRLLHAGVDTSVIALWLGHAQIDTTQFLEFCEAWGQRYPAIVRLWENA